MIWVIGFLILIVALLIPILAIVMDSPALRNAFERRLGSPQLKELTEKVAVLEDEIEELGRAVQTLREETQFMQRLLEEGEARPKPPTLPSPKH
jgi:signal transduction histidine kinase